MENLMYVDKKTLSAVFRAVKQSFTRYSDERRQILELKCYRGGPKNGRRWDCEKCKNSIELKDLEVDHIKPHIPLDKSVSELSFKDLYERCFTSLSNLQILCKNCHKFKSKVENKIRSDNRKRRKNG